MYLKGAALECVGYFLLSTDDAYQEAMSLVEQRYGHPFLIANAFRDKLESWQKVALARHFDMLGLYVR